LAAGVIHFDFGMRESRGDSLSIFWLVSRLQPVFFCDRYFFVFWFFQGVERMIFDENDHCGDSGDNHVKEQVVADGSEAVDSKLPSEIEIAIEKLFDQLLEALNSVFPTESKDPTDSKD
jgi:hypothetical protein